MIYCEDHLLKVNGVLLPGVVKSIEIKESAQIDEQEVEGSAVKPKQATGYEDAKITIELLIDDTPTQTKYQRLAVVRAMFRKAGQTVPQPLAMVGEDLAAHGISKVLFKGLSHKAESKSGWLPVSLEFWEYIPQTITAKKSSASSAESGAAGSTQSTLSSNYKSYLATKRGKSPAVDNASGQAAYNRVRDLPY